MLNKYKIDLHIHSCLSPCADLTMLPSLIIEEAKKNKLDCIGISDHNSADNVRAIKNAGKKQGILVIGGMEITTREEVHILAFFETDKALRVMQKKVCKNLAGENDENIFGEQLVVDENDGILGSCTKFLLGASGLSLEETVDAINTLDGIAIASHVDREMFSIIGQLGYIPDKLDLHALELSPNYDFNKNINFNCLGYSVVRFSDAHYLQDIGKTSTTLLLPALSFSDIKKTLQSEDRRKIGFD